MLLLLLLLVLLAPTITKSEEAPEVFDARRSSHADVTDGEMKYMKAVKDQQEEEKNQQPPPQPPPSSTIISPISISSTPFEVTPSVLLEYTPLSKPYGIEMSTSLDATQFANLQTSAEGGSADSSYFIGLAYLYGLGGQKSSPVKAFRYFRTSASQGHGDAMCATGILLYYGWGVGRDTKGAVAWFNAASEANVPRGHWLLGRAYYEGRVSKVPDFDEAGRLFGLAAEEGVGEAMYHLGVMFEYGLISDKDSTGMDEGMPRNSNTPYSSNFRKAAEMYEEAWGKHRVAEAGYHLALMHAYGRGMPQNAVKASDLFRVLANDHVHAGAMRYLGIFAVYGHGMPDDVSDYEKAVVWFDKCARVNDETISGKCKLEREEIRQAVDRANGRIDDMMKTFGSSENGFESFTPL